MSIRPLFFALILLSSPFGYAHRSPLADPKKMGVIADLEFMKHVFDIQYAPKQWKESYTNWNLELEKEWAKDRIIALSSVKDDELRKIFQTFLLSCQDYHVSPIFYSSEAAFLPFRIRSAEGRYFFQSVDRTQLPESLYPFQRGDEILSFDGRPIDEVVQELKLLYFGSANHDLTNQSLAENFLTSREAFRGFQVPRGPVHIQVRRKGDSKVRRYQLIWDYYADVNTVPKRMNALPAWKEQAGDLVRSDDDLLMGNRKMVPGFWRMGSKSGNQKSDPDWIDPIADRNGPLPPLGIVRWKTNPFNPFHAYLYETADGHLIGYVRIPIYDGTDLHAEEFGKIIAYFEQEAEALVIDQMDNPGGLVLYMYALASMLTEDSLQAPRHRMALTQKDVRTALWELPLYESIQTDEQAKRYLGYTFGYPPSYQLARFYVEYLYFLIDQWNQGNVLTAPTFIEGVDAINPHPRYRFTKPIVVLVNETCFSGGDFFPAILQDNHRAVIFGQRTAGAGGVVSEVVFTNESGIQSFAITTSLAERVDQQPLENIGVAPDVVYSLSVEDLEENYASYKQAVNETVIRLLTPPPAEEIVPAQMQKPSLIDKKEQVPAQADKAKKKKKR